MRNITHRDLAATKQKGHSAGVNKLIVLYKGGHMHDFQPASYGVGKWDGYFTLVTLWKCKKCDKMYDHALPDEMHPLRNGECVQKQIERKTEAQHIEDKNLHQYKERRKK